VSQVASNIEVENDDILIGIFNPQQVQSWGDKATNKTSEKWKRRVVARVKKKVWKESSDVRISNYVVSCVYKMRYNILSLLRSGTSTISAKFHQPLQIQICF
jgi:hypothetical protein